MHVNSLLQRYLHIKRCTMRSRYFIVLNMFYKQTYSCKHFWNRGGSGFILTAGKMVIVMIVVTTTALAVQCFPCFVMSEVGYLFTFLHLH